MNSGWRQAAYKTIHSTKLYQNRYLGVVFVGWKSSHTAPMGWCAGPPGAFVTAMGDNGSEQGFGSTETSLLLLKHL